LNLHTASEIISFSKKLESDSAKLYKDLSLKYPKDKDLFLSFAKENEANIIQIERAYYGVISDAIEGGFAFDIESDAYVFEVALPQNTSYADALAKAGAIEEKILKFYADASHQSDSLMADVPRAFKLVAKKRESRLTKLKQLL
jgi:predicted GNAT superfamily acetyltransferase